MARGKRIAFRLIAVASALLLSALAAELVLRLAGFEPADLEKWDHVTVEPGGKKFRKHPTLGYAHLPGRFKVTIRGEYSYTITHRPDGLRITHPIEEDAAYADKPKVWIMGGSFTHGNSLNDDETYPWLLQRRYPHHEFVNFGVEGYGTIQALIELREGLESKDPPEVVVLGYASLHDERNTFLNALRKRRYRYNRLGPLVQPYARLDADGELRLFEADVSEYRPWPLSGRSALVDFLQDRYDAFRDGRIDSHAVTEALVAAIHQICVREGIELVLVNLYVPDDIASFCESEGILFIDAHVQLGRPENNNLPYDGHPSAFANWQFAERIVKPFDDHDVLGRLPVDPGVEAAWLIDLGLAYYENRYFPPALEAFERAAGLAPDLAVAHNNVCSVQARMGRWDAAARACERALELDPELRLARDNLAWAERKRQETRPR